MSMPGVECGAVSISTSVASDLRSVSCNADGVAFTTVGGFLRIAPQATEHLGDRNPR